MPRAEAPRSRGSTRVTTWRPRRTSARSAQRFCFSSRTKVSSLTCISRLPSNWAQRSDGYLVGLLRLRLGAHFHDRQMGHVRPFFLRGQSRDIQPVVQFAHAVGGVGHAHEYRRGERTKGLNLTQRYRKRLHLAADLFQSFTGGQSRCPGERVEEVWSGAPRDAEARGATAVGGVRQILRPDSSGKPPGRNAEFGIIHANYTPWQQWDAASLAPSGRKKVGYNRNRPFKFSQSGRSAAW